MEEPETPDLVLENYGDIDPYHALETVWRQIVAPPRNASARGARSAQFRTKAETLALLALLLRSGRVLPQVRFTGGNLA